MMFTYYDECEYEHKERGTERECAAGAEETTLSFESQTMDVHIEVHDTIADGEIKDGNKKPNKCGNSSTQVTKERSWKIPCKTG